MFIPVTPIIEKEKNMRIILASILIGLDILVASKIVFGITYPSVPAPAYWWWYLVLYLTQLLYVLVYILDKRNSQ